MNPIALSEDYELCPFVRVSYNPGHTPDDVSVIVQVPDIQQSLSENKFVGKVYAITGEYIGFCIRIKNGKELNNNLDYIVQVIYFSKRLILNSHKFGLAITLILEYQDLWRDSTSIGKELCLWLITSFQDMVQCLQLLRITEKYCKAKIFLTF